MLTLLLLTFPAALIVLPTTILFVIGMAPTIVAYIVDRDPGKSAPIIVGGPNFCGCMFFAIDLWKHHHNVMGALKIFSDPMAWLVMYGAAAVGWAFYYAIPPAIAGAEIMRAENRIEALKQAKVALVQEWGPDVAGDAFGAPLSGLEAEPDAEGGRA
jgi:hypothetical protein